MNTRHFFRVLWWRLEIALLGCFLLALAGCGGGGGSSSHSSSSTTIAIPTGYTVTDLGTLGGSESEALAINDNGAVVGQSQTASGDKHAFLYSSGIKDLGVLSGDIESIATAINDNGQVVGSSDSSTHDHAFFYNGTIHALGTLSGSTDSDAYGINAAGQAVGDGPTPSKATTIDAILYTISNNTASVQDIGTIGATDSVIAAINKSGLICGYGPDTANASTTGFVYTNKTKTVLATLGGAVSAATALNDNGDIVGGAQTAADGTSKIHGFLYSGGTMTNLGTLPSEPVTVALAINNNQFVVGYSGSGADFSIIKLSTSFPIPIGRLRQSGTAPQTTPSASAFIYYKGRLVSLTSLIANNPGWTLEQPMGINASGQICGIGSLNGATHAFLLTPK